MKIILKKLLAFLSVAALVMTMIPLYTATAATSGGFTYTVTNGVATITGYSGSATKLTIPATLGGYPVTSIGDWAFEDCTSLTSITIPDSVTSIGYYAFCWCTSLTSITIPDSVTSIGDGAFQVCTSLTNITIPDSVTSIGDGAFYGCSSLTSITVGDDNPTYASEDGVLFNKDKTTLIVCPGRKTTCNIPDSVTSIGDDAFYGYSSLTSITVGDDNPTYASEDGVLFNKDKTTLIVCPGRKTTCNIPDSVTSIGDDAFYGCSSLTSITIPNSVTSIGDDAFYGCSSLTSITIPNGVTSIGNWAFQVCSSLTSITIPNGVTSIGDGAFYWCRSLTSITIPDSVTSIGDDAFYGCDSLKSVIYRGSAEDRAKITIGNSNKNLTNATWVYNVIGTVDNVFYTRNEDNGATVADYTGTDTEIRLPYEVEGYPVSMIVSGAFSNLSVTDVYYTGTKKQWNAITIQEDAGLENTRMHFSVLADMSLSDHWELVEVITPNTCMKEGLGSFACPCGHVCERVIPAPGHAYDDGEVIAPTCTVQGYTVYTCEECGDSFTVEDTSTLPHNYDVTDVIAPTCTAQGYTAYVCVDCGDAYHGDYVEMIDHAYEIIDIVAPTCTEEGYTVYRCAACGAVKNDDYQSPAHTYQTTVIAPTCTSDGYTIYTCIYGDDTYRGDLLVAAHSFENNMCDYCGLSVDACLASPHKYPLNYDNTWVVRQPCAASITLTFSPETTVEDEYDHIYLYDGNDAPIGTYTGTELAGQSITVSGDTVKIRLVSDDSMNDYGFVVTDVAVTFLNGVDHDYGEWEVTSPATCTKEGVMTQICASCKKTKTKAIPLLEHDYEAVVTNPTCEAQGYTTHTCSVCGDAYADSYIDSTGHTPGEWHETVAPSCESNGEEQQNCVVCGTILATRDVLAVGHNFGEWEVTSPATCTKEGVMTQICASCGKTKTKAIPLLEHDYEVAVTNPTCEEQGYTTHTCSVCGDAYVDSYTDSTGHTPGEWHETVAPSCENSGEEQQNCVVCGTILATRDVSAVGHNFGEWYIVTEATFNEDGEEHRDCTNCDHYESRRIPKLSENCINGDVNGDSILDSTDIRLVLRAITGLTAFTDGQLQIADVNEDGKMNSADVRRMLLMIAYEA